MKRQEKYELQNEAYRAGWEDAISTIYSCLRNQAKAFCNSDWSQADVMSAVTDMNAHATLQQFTPDMDEDRLS